MASWIRHTANGPHFQKRDYFASTDNSGPCVAADFRTKRTWDILARPNGRPKVTHNHLLLLKFHQPRCSRIPYLATSIIPNKRLHTPMPRERHRFSYRNILPPRLGNKSGPQTMRRNLSQRWVHELRAASHNASHRLIPQRLGYFTLVDSPEDGAFRNLCPEQFVQPRLESHRGFPHDGL